MDISVIQKIYIYLTKLSYCKELWFLISDTVCRCEKQLVEDEIKKETKLLKEGLLFFKPYTEVSLQNIPKNDPSPRMYELISKLAPLLVCIINKFYYITNNFSVII